MDDMTFAVFSFRLFRGKVAKNDDYTQTHPNRTFGVAAAESKKNRACS